MSRGTGVFLPRLADKVCSDDDSPRLSAAQASPSSKDRQAKTTPAGLPDRVGSTVRPGDSGTCTVGCRAASVVGSCAQQQGGDIRAVEGSGLSHTTCPTRSRSLLGRSEHSLQGQAAAIGLPARRNTFPGAPVGLLTDTLPAGDHSCRPHAYTADSSRPSHSASLQHQQGPPAQHHLQCSGSRSSSSSSGATPKSSTIATAPRCGFEALAADGIAAAVAQRGSRASCSRAMPAAYAANMANSRLGVVDSRVALQHCGLQPTGSGSIMCISSLPAQRVLCGGAATSGVAVHQAVAVLAPCPQQVLQPAAATCQLVLQPRAGINTSNISSVNLTPCSSQLVSCTTVQPGPHCMVQQAAPISGASALDELVLHTRIAAATVASAAPCERQVFANCSSSVAGHSGQLAPSQGSMHGGPHNVLLIEPAMQLQLQPSARPPFAATAAAGAAAPMTAATAGTAADSSSLASLQWPAGALDLPGSSSRLPSSNVSQLLSSGLLPSPALALAASSTELPLDPQGAADSTALGPDVASTAAALVQEKLEQVQQLKAMQQQLMDQVMVLLPLV